MTPGQAAYVTWAHRREENTRGAFRCARWEDIQDDALRADWEAAAEAAVIAYAGGIDMRPNVVIEYGERVNDGGFNLWPPDNEDYPTAKRITHARRNGQTVISRRIRIMEDWTEVDAP